MDAYRTIYEHHQKDADGKVIEHGEKEELNEGRMRNKKDILPTPTPSKPDKPSTPSKPDKPSTPSKPVPQMNDVDLFDLVKGKLIDEGCDEQEAIKIMVNMSEEELNEISEGVGAALLGGALATGLTIKGLQTFNKMKNDAKKRDLNTVGGKIQSATDAKNKALKDAGM
tara:strand:- start:66 stop:572 length:507 start_codon:yes stop_codon:yes gene_type:complete